MTDNQNYHLLRIKSMFDAAVDAKYRAGVKEHGGNLWEMTPLQLLDNAMSECVDQWTYLQTLRDAYLRQEKERLNAAR